MKGFTNTQKINGELACRNLTEKAAKFYGGTDPLDVFEIDKDGAKLYSVRGAFDADGLTFEELNAEFEDYQTAYDEEVNADLNKVLTRVIGKGTEYKVINPDSSEKMDGTMYGDDDCWDDNNFYQLFVTGTKILKCFYNADEVEELDQIDYTKPYEVQDVTSEYEYL